MKRALVFSGQGSHRQGMAMDIVATTAPPVVRVWERMKSRMQQNYGFPLQAVVMNNPVKVTLHADARDVGLVCARSCHEQLNRPESHPLSAIVTHPKGVMALTSFTQPCMLAAQMVMLMHLRLPASRVTERLSAVHTISGHSLGEFSALCALGVFSPEVAIDLVYKRGLLMEDAVASHALSPNSYALYACNPSRAKLHDDPEAADDIFFIFVELVARSLSTTSSFLEVVNYNTLREQYIVAGDLVGLSVLGKCLDPQFRANGCPENSTLDGIVRSALGAARQDQSDGVTTDPNRGPAPDFVTSSFKRYGTRHTFRRFMRGPDDGYTPSLEELTHLTLQEDGRSGLKKKSWFMPLSVEVPFHSSRLRRAMDLFLPVVLDALPPEEQVRALLSVGEVKGSEDFCGSPRPLWVTNLTGTVFRPLCSTFQNEAMEALSSMNVGEVRHHGRYSSDAVLHHLRAGIDSGSARDICAAVLAGQMAHPVQWIDAMQTMVVNEGCGEIIEIAPARTLCDMFKRSVFVNSPREPPALSSCEEGSLPACTSSGAGTRVTVTARCLPEEMHLLDKTV